MLRSAPDDARDMVHDIQLHSERHGRENRLIKGREIVGIKSQSFRSSDRSDMMFTIEHLIRLEYPGDKNMSVFRNKSYDILLNLRKEDTPREITLRDILYHKIRGLEFGLSTYARLPDTHAEKTYRFLLGLTDRQLRTDREDYVYDMKEKSVKNLLSGNKSAAPAEKKTTKGKGGNSGKEDSGNTAAPVLPKAKAKDHDKKGKGKGKGKSMSPEQKKEWPYVFHHTKEGGCLKGKECPHSQNPNHKHKLDNSKGKGKGGGKGARTPSPKRDGVCYAWREGKCTKADQCKYKHAETVNLKASAPAPNAKQQAKAQAKPPAIVRQVLIAMPAITAKRAATSEAKKDNKGAEESEAEVETVHHDRDAEDAMSESSRWSGEPDIPEKYVWFQEILDNDVSEEVEYLKNEDEQWRNNSMWYKGFFDDASKASPKPVEAKTFNTYMIIDGISHTVTRRHSSEQRL